MTFTGVLVIFLSSAFVKSLLIASLLLKESFYSGLIITHVYFQVPISGL